MGMKRWDHPPGRAIRVVYGQQVVICHPCRRYVPMPPLDVPFDPCPFICKHCGTRGVIKDSAEAPVDYAPQSWTMSGAAFLAPKLRRKATR
jgi:hypothetical protein